MRGILLLLIFSLYAYGDSFYSLSGVKHFSYYISVPKEDKKLKIKVKKLMQFMSKELGIKQEGKSSRILVFIIKNFSVGDTVAVKMTLELAEYAKRVDTKEQVFVLSYVDEILFQPEDFEEDILENAEDMLDKFSMQYKDDNKNFSVSNKEVSHDDFASQMKYETDYKTALKKAKKESKKVMLFMTTDYCPWCRKMENTILSQKNIDDKIKQKHITLILNLDKKKFPKKLGKIKITPILYIIDPNSEKIEKNFIGYSNRERFLDFIQ